MAPTNTSLGIALSGGGARGVAHLGVLKALNEHQILPSCVSGTSAGAIVGGFYAAGFSPDEILNIVIKTKMMAIFKPAFSLKGLLKMDSLLAILKENLPDKFEDLPLPFTAVATAIEAGTTQYFTSGDLHASILASSCLPVVFQPIEINNVKYVDGGLLNNLPVEAIAGKANQIIAVSCNPIRQRTIKNVKDVMERSSLLAINENTKKSKVKASVFIEPDELIKFSGFDLSKAKQIFEVGYQYTSENIAIFAEKLNH